MHYELAVPAESREATERALALHPQGCPAHQSVQGAIEVTWDARVRVGDEVVTLRSQPGQPPAESPGAVPILDRQRGQPLT
jgi:hypothetical protein